MICSLTLRLSFVCETGKSGRWNLRVWLPTAAASGGADKDAATRLIVSIHA